MGTRHLTCVVAGGEYKIAQYGQWDGYPEGAGVDVLAFLRDKMDRETFPRKVLALKEITSNDIQERYQSLGADGSGWISMDISDKFKVRWPHLHRDTGADILAYVQDAPDGLEVKRQLSFAADSLFCEWAWVVDLDKGTFEAFKGYNRTPLESSERFAHLAYDREGPNEDDQYYQVRHVKTWPLSQLPTKEDFLSTFKEDDD